jgi:uncharacterized protein (DUF2384 family)
MDEFEIKINQILLSLLGSQELVQKWWSSPNKAFDNEIPDDLYHSDMHNVVVKYILAMSAGDYS